MGALAAAEAEADAFYGTYGHHQGLYNAAVQTYNRYPADVTRYSGYPAFQAPAITAYAAPGPLVVKDMPYGYAASGRYLADSVGAVHMAKREAEAEPEAESEADSALFYRFYGQQRFFNNAFNSAYNTYSTAYPTYPVSS